MQLSINFAAADLFGTIYELLVIMQIVFGE